MKVGKQTIKPDAAPKRPPRKPPQTGQVTPPLSAGPQQIEETNRKVPRLRRQVGGPAVPAGADPVVVQYDMRVGTKAKRAARAIRLRPDLFVVDGLDVPRMNQMIGQLPAAQEFRADVEDLSQNVDASRALVQRKELRMAGRLVRTIRARLSLLTPGSPEYNKLKAESRPVMDRWTAIKATATQTAKQTKKQGKATTKEVTAVQEKQGLAETLLAVNEGKPVDPQQENALLDAYGTGGGTGDQPGGRRTTKRG